MSWLSPLLSIIDRLITYRSLERARLKVIALKSHRRDALARYLSHITKSTEQRAAGDISEAKATERKAIAESRSISGLTLRIENLEKRMDDKI